jgi:ribonuclease HII
VLLDGNPLHIDSRELSLVKGDARVAAISAASIIAKVARDRLMMEYDKTYPAYDFASNKGYGSAEHIAAIGRYGLTPIHRKSFCRNFSQESLF